MPALREPLPTGRKEYDLTESNRFGWVTGIRSAMLGLRAFTVVLLGDISYGVYLMARSTGLDSAHLVGVPLLYFCGGMLLLVSVRYRPPAVRLMLDDSGIHLIYHRGKQYFQGWSDPDFVVRGRWTPGVRDAISRGRPLYSIYGRFGGLTETFIPEVAYSDLKTQSESRGFILAEPPGNRGWTLWAISPPNSP